MPAQKSQPVSVVTGGAGFLGSHLTDRLLAEGHRVIAIDNLITGNTANFGHLAGNENYRFIKHNVSNFIFLPEEKIDYVFHFASPASPIDYLELPIPTLKVGALARITRSVWQRTKKRHSFSHPPRKCTAIRLSIRKRKITGAMSTRSGRVAFTTRPSVSPRRSPWPIIVITAWTQESCASSTRTDRECVCATGALYRHLLGRHYAASRSASSATVRRRARSVTSPI